MLFAFISYTTLILASLCVVPVLAAAIIVPIVLMMIRRSPPQEATANDRKRARFDQGPADAPMEKKSSDEFIADEKRSSDSNVVE